MYRDGTPNEKERQNKIQDDHTRVRFRMRQRMPNIGKNPNKNSKATCKQHYQTSYRRIRMFRVED